MRRLQQQCRVRVAKIVDADVPQPGLVQNAAKHVPHVPLADPAVRTGAGVVGAPAFLFSATSTFGGVKVWGYRFVHEMKPAASWFSRSFPILDLGHLGHPTVLVHGYVEVVVAVDGDHE